MNPTELFYEEYIQFRGLISLEDSQGPSRWPFSSPMDLVHTYSLYFKASEISKHILPLCKTLRHLWGLRNVRSATIPDIMNHAPRKHGPPFGGGEICFRTPQQKRIPERAYWEEVFLQFMKHLRRTRDYERRVSKILWRLLPKLTLGAALVRIEQFLRRVAMTIRKNRLGRTIQDRVVSVRSYQNPGVRALFQKLSRGEGGVSPMASLFSQYDLARNVLEMAGRSWAVAHK